MSGGWPERTSLQAPRPAPAPAKGVSADLREIATDLWRRRDLLYQLARRDVRIRYKQAVMGFAWAIFMPLLVVLAGFLIRLAMATVSGSELQTTTVAVLAVKSLPWAFFVGSIGFTVNSLTGNMNLVSKVYFPREVLPLASVGAQLFDTLIGAVGLLAILPFLGVRPTAALLWVPLLALILIMFTAASGLFLSCANLFFRDVKYIVQVMLTFGIFFTPVLFEPAMLGPTGAQLVMLNPLAPILEGMRLAVVEGHNLAEPLTQLTKSGMHAVAWQPWYLLYSGAWAVGGLIGSALMFHRLEFVFAEYV